MDEIIKIKCPFCGTVLSVKNQPGIEKKHVTCPICKNKYPFTEFKRVSPGATYNNEEPDTEYPETDDTIRHSGNDKTETQLPQMNFTLGRLKVVGTTTVFPLRTGRNVVGRKSEKSQADFKIDTAEKRAMSREHILIEVKKLPVKGFVHYVSLYKKEVNKTFIGNEPLVYGDVLILGHGDVIRLPDATLKFEIPDDEATEI